DLADRLDIQIQHLAVVARVHGRDAVHHDVVLGLPAEPRRAAAARQRGVNATAAAKFPWLMGRLSICLVSTANDLSPLCVCTNATSAVTLTVSTVAPTSSVSVGTPTRSPPVTTTPGLRRVLN